MIDESSNSYLLQQLASRIADKAEAIIKKKKLKDSEITKKGNSLRLVTHQQGNKIEFSFSQKGNKVDMSMELPGSQYAERKSIVITGNTERDSEEVKRFLNTGLNMVTESMLNEISGKPSSKYKSVELKDIDPLDKKDVVQFALTLQGELGIEVDYSTRDMGKIFWQAGGKRFSLEATSYTTTAPDFEELDKSWYWMIMVDGKQDNILGDIEDYNAKDIARLIKSRYKKLYEAKKETTTANVADFQHKLGGDPEEGNCKEGYIWDADQQKCVPQTNEGLKDDIIFSRSEAGIMSNGFKKTFKKHFPKSLFEIDFSRSSFGSRYILRIDFTLGANKTEWANGYSDNDPMKHIITIDYFNEDGSILDKAEMRLIRGGHVYTVPEEGSYYALGTVKVPYRKVTANDPKKFIAGFERYIKRLAKTVSDNADKIQAMRDIPYDVAKRVNEDTISGQAFGSPSTGAVAGTDTRFGGPTFEPVFFDDKSKENDALSNEKTFYNTDNRNVLLPGFEYVDDYAKRVGIEIDQHKPEQGSNIDNPDKDDKTQNAIDWSLEAPKNSYKKLLQKLRDLHNI